MDYREKPRDKPLIWALCRRVIAIDLLLAAELKRHIIFGRLAHLTQPEPAHGVVDRLG